MIEDTGATVRAGQVGPVLRISVEAPNVKAPPRNRVLSFVEATSEGT